jgi:RHS repeat-associated protein
LGGGFMASSRISTTLYVPETAFRIHYYHQDHLGSSDSLTDNNGQPLEQSAFLPFGSPRRKYLFHDLSEAYNFCQKELDGESGLDYFEARYLASSIPRFVRVDPVVHAPQSIVRMPQSLNAYSYSINNPINLRDPSGNETVGEIIDRRGVDAAAKGNNWEAKGWAFASTAWEYLGAEHVSKLADAWVNGRKDLRVLDFVEAGFEIGGAIQKVDKRFAMKAV